MGDSKAAMFVRLTQEVVSLTASPLYTTWNAPEACVETGKRDCNIRKGSFPFGGTRCQCGRLKLGLDSHHHGNRFIFFPHY